MKSYGKDHAEYWKRRLKKRCFKNCEGENIEVLGWQIYVAHRKTRRWYNTGSSNKTEAATQARDFYRDLVANGWDFVDKKYNMGSIPTPLEMTVGDYLKLVGRASVIRPKTLATYTRKFRTLVAESQSIEDADKHDYVNGGSKVWNEKVEAVPLRKLTDEVVRKWIRTRIQGSQNNDFRLNKAKITINSILRNSKSLFSKKISEAVRIELPEDFFSKRVNLESVRQPRFVSKVSIKEILERAKRLPIEGDDGIELYKILVLALTAGLRREEIDRLRWEDVDFERKRIIVQSSTFGTVKSACSEGEVDIDESVADLFFEYFKQRNSPFVIESGVRPRPNALYPHYRCHSLFRSLTKWLRENGVKSQKPLHELRKEFGSQICAQGGIFAASAQLRHSDIRITRDHYLEKKNRICVSLL